MGHDYSVSMEGLRAAERQLNQAARKVSRMGTSDSQTGNSCEAAASVDETSDRLTLAGDGDVAGAMVESQQAKMQYLANLKVLTAQSDLEEKTLDLFG